MEFFFLFLLFFRYSQSTYVTWAINHAYRTLTGQRLLDSENSAQAITRHAELGARLIALLRPKMAVTRRDEWGWTGSKWRRWTVSRCLAPWTGWRGRRGRRSWALRRRRRRTARRPPPRPRRRPARPPTQVPPATRLVFFLECFRSLPFDTSRKLRPKK